MRKNRFTYVFLMALYGLLFIFTIVMQSISIQNLEMKLLVNVSTFLLTLLAALVFYALLREDIAAGEKSEEGGRNEGKERAEEEILPTGEEYLYLAKKWGFTKRETEIGFLVLNGYTNRQLAEELYISETTVKKHMTHIYEKAGVSGRRSFKEEAVRILKEQKV